MESVFLDFLSDVENMSEPMLLMMSNYSLRYAEKIVDDRKVIQRLEKKKVKRLIIQREVERSEVKKSNAMRCKIQVKTVKYK